MFCQENTLQGVTEGYDFLYQANNSEEAPAPEDIEYSYMSDYYTDYALQMADLASKGVWSANAINDTTDSQSYFENGTSGAFVWNSSIFTAGDNLESADLGTYAVYDVTPDTKRSRGAYSVDATAITEKSADPERAALVLDYMKSDVNLNRLLLETELHLIKQQIIHGTAGHGRLTDRMSLMKQEWMRGLLNTVSIVKRWNLSQLRQVSLLIHHLFRISILQYSLLLLNTSRVLLLEFMARTQKVLLKNSEVI